MWQAAFSSNRVLKNRRPLFEIGEEFGTSATSPRRRAPSSLSRTFLSTSSPRAAFAPTRMRGREYLLGRDVRIAGNSVLRRRRASLPLVAVREPDREFRARPGIVQGVKVPGVQPFRPDA